ncbi:hypothetical protein [Methylocystis echinoides]|uniref:hypothetical protein n=1 Tax=Methylocystis echinoides TaxID=29468 RepID=UPI00341CBDC9
MANTEGHGGQPPAAWVWSQYRGVLPAETEAPAADSAVPTPDEASPAGGGQKHGLIGLGLAAAVIVIAGLTWLFTTRSAYGPAPEATPPAATGSETPQKSEAAPPPPAAAPAPAATETPAPAAEAPKAAPPATPRHDGDHGKKKKKHQG